MADFPESNKKPFVDDKTIVTAEFLTSIFGEGTLQAQADGYTPAHPFFNGHLHDDGQTWGHAPKINLADHVTGVLNLPIPQLKTIQLSATQAVPLISSMFWTVQIPPDAVSSYVDSDGNTVLTPPTLIVYWSATGSGATSGSVAFRVDWEYIALGENVLPPSVVTLDSPTYWPPNLQTAANPTPYSQASGTPFRFGVAPAVNSILYANNNATQGIENPITMSFITEAGSGITRNVTNSTLMGIEVSSSPTVNQTSPFSQIHVYGIAIRYYSQQLGITADTVVSGVATGTANGNPVTNNGSLTDY